MKKILPHSDSHNRPRWVQYRAALALAGLALAGSGASALAGGNAPSLSLPLDCVPGKSCWIAKFVDLDPGPAVRDYTCHGRANDGHTGVDIALRDRRAMDEGVSVLAAAPGTVLRTRDGMQDISARELGAAMLKGGECGNGVVIDHGNGWETQYCHMRQDSIAVKPGDHVEAGQKLGLVGMSGSSEYPHLHVMARYNDKIVDPFVGLEDRSGPNAKCGPGAAPLWNEKTLAALAYVPASIYNIGFAEAKPDEADVDKGRFRGTEFSREAPWLILWVEIFGVEKGDQLHLRLSGPDGAALLDKVVSIPGRKARWYQYIGKRRPGSGWPKGAYRGEVTLTRNDNGAPASTEATAEAYVGVAAPKAAPDPAPGATPPPAPKSPSAKPPPAPKSPASTTTSAPAPPAPVPSPVPSPSPPAPAPGAPASAAAPAPAPVPEQTAARPSSAAPVQAAASSSEAEPDRGHEIISEQTVILIFKVVVAICVALPLLFILARRLRGDG